MAIKMVNTVLGMPVEAYDAAMQHSTDALQRTPGFVSHTAEVSEDAITVTEVWLSRDQWQAWFDTSVRPHLPPDAQEPTITEIHNVVSAG